VVRELLLYLACPAPVKWSQIESSQVKLSDGTWLAVLMPRSVLLIQSAALSLEAERLVKVRTG